MNKPFREYVTGTVFDIHLSKRQCWGLLALLDRNKDHLLFSGQFISISKDLRARGLIENDKKNIANRKQTKEIGINPCHKLTTAGKLVVKLLKEAGLTMEKTKTLSVIKGLECWFKK